MKPHRWEPGDCAGCQYRSSKVNHPVPCPDHVGDYNEATDWRNRLLKSAGLIPETSPGIPFGRPTP